MANESLIFEVAAFHKPQRSGVSAERRHQSMWKFAALYRGAATTHGHSVRPKLAVETPMNLEAVSVAQTALSAVSQVGNLRAPPDTNVPLVSTPADSQSAIRQAASLRYDGGTTSRAIL